MPHERMVTEWVDEHINTHRDDQLIYKFQSKRHKEVFSALTKDYLQKLRKLTLFGRGLEAYIEHHLYEFRMDIYLNDRRLQNHSRIIRLLAGKALRINKELLHTKKVSLKRSEGILFSLIASFNIKKAEIHSSIEDISYLNIAYKAVLGDLTNLYKMHSNSTKYCIKLNIMHHKATVSADGTIKLLESQLATLLRDIKALRESYKNLVEQPIEPGFETTVPSKAANTVTGKAANKSKETTVPGKDANIVPVYFETTVPGKDANTVPSKAVAARAVRKKGRLPSADPLGPGTDTDIDIGGKRSFSSSSSSYSPRYEGINNVLGTIRLSDSEGLRSGGTRSFSSASGGKTKTRSQKENKLEALMKKNESDKERVLTLLKEVNTLIKITKKKIARSVKKKDSLINPPTNASSINPPASLINPPTNASSINPPASLINPPTNANASPPPTNANASSINPPTNASSINPPASPPASLINPPTNAVDPERKKTESAEDPRPSASSPTRLNLWDAVSNPLNLLKSFQSRGLKALDEGRGFFKFPTITTPNGWIPNGWIPTLKAGLLRGFFLLLFSIFLPMGAAFGDSLSNVFVKLSNVFVKLSNVFVEEVEILTVGDRMILPTLIAALGISYAFHYRKVKNHKETAKLLLQVIVTFLSIQLLLDIFGIKLGLAPMLEKNDERNLAVASDTAVASDPAPADPAAASDGDGPLTQPDAWYYSKKVWGCAIVVGLAVVAAVYYLKGFAPISPDDMDAFTTSASRGIENVASEQVSLSRTLTERAAAIRADLQNRTSGEILSDIVAAGDVARQQLEQMTGVTQDLTQLRSRVDNINDRMTVLLRGIVYLISLRWVLSRYNSAPSEGSAPAAAGSDAVNAVMSSERPLSFDFPISIPTAADAATVAQTEAPATYEISTQTDGLDSDRILSVVDPAVAKYGINRVLWGLRSVLPVVEASIDVSDSDTTQYTSESSNPRRSLDSEMTPLGITLQSEALASDLAAGSDAVEIQEVEIEVTDPSGTSKIRVEMTGPSGTSEVRAEVIREMESTEHSPVTDVSTRSPVAVTDSSTRSPVAVTDSSDRLESTVRSSDLSSLQSEITPRRLDEDESFRVTDNPTFQPTAVGAESPTPSVISTHFSPPSVQIEPQPPSSASALASAPPIEPQNPYQFHRYSFFRVARFFPDLWDFLMNRF